MTDHDYNTILATVEATVARGNDAPPEGWDARVWLDKWLDHYVPALGETPRECLQRADGLDRVLGVISASAEGVYL